MHDCFHILRRLYLNHVMPMQQPRLGGAYAFNEKPLQVVTKPGLRFAWVLERMELEFPYPVAPQLRSSQSYIFIFGLSTTKHNRPYLIGRMQKAASCSNPLISCYYLCCSISVFYFRIHAFVLSTLQFCCRLPHYILESDFNVDFRLFNIYIFKKFHFQ